MAIENPPVRIDPPADLAPARGTLLSTFPGHTPEDSHWEGGVTFRPQGGCEAATSWAPCSGAIKPSNRPSGTNPTFRPVEHIGQYTCSTTGGLVPGGEDFRQHARWILEGWFSTQLEKELWTGRLATENGLENRFLTDGSADSAWTGSGTLPWPFALARLQKRLREQMGDTRGVIHMSPYAAGMYIEAQMVKIVDEHLEDAFGNLIIAGAGYSGISTYVSAEYVLTSTASGGTFTLTVTNPADGTEETTADIDFDATDTEVQTALLALDSMLGGDVIVSGGPVGSADVTIGFSGRFARQHVIVTADDTNLTGGSITSFTNSQTGGAVDAEPQTSTMFATSPILPLVENELRLLPETDAEAVDRSVNLATFRAERTGIAVWDGCVHLTIDADFTTACTFPDQGD